MSTAFGSLSLFSENISDPSYQLSRLSCIDRNNFLICDADQLKLVSLESKYPLVLDDYLDSGNVSRCNSYSLNNLTSIRATAATAPKRMFQSVQLITTHQQMQAVAVTSHGDLTSCPVVKDATSGSYSFGSPSFGCITNGPGCGYVSLCHTSDRHVTSHYLSKILVWSDMSTMTATRQSTLFQNPTCTATTSTASGPSLVMVAEGGNVAVLDERQHSKGGCVFRENENSNGGVLWDILPLGADHRVAAAGSDKNIRIYDTRMWKTITRWRAPHKFDVVKLLPSSNSSLQLYVAGRDNEVLLCDLEPHLLATQVAKGKGRSGQASVAAAVAGARGDDDDVSGGAAAADADLNPPLKKQRSTDNTSAAVDSSGAGSELLPMQLPTSSKLRISHHRGIRAESVWAGLDVVLGTEGEHDRLVGLCGHGKLYLADGADLMRLAI